MLKIKERPNLTQRILTHGYRQLQFMLDPVAYTKDLTEIARKELDARHQFYVVPDLNKPPHLEPDNADNLTDAERERWFGKSRLHSDDNHWEAMEKLLLPIDRRHAVARVNGAVDGSHNNERFSLFYHRGSPNRAGYSETDYMPRTVTAYASEEQARVAAKVLRILTKDTNGSKSVATILSEKIENGTDKPVWVVSDNMDMKTHNALRLYFSNMSQQLPGDAQKRHQQQSQAEVNRRLPPGETWEALPGIPTLLTLQGRPGVKMYKKIGKKDDAKDVARLSRIPEQELPRIVNGVPHELIIASDGRQYFEPGDTFATVACLLVGPKGYTFLRTGSLKTMGELVGSEATFLKRPLQSDNSFSLGRNTAESIVDFVSLIADKSIFLGGGLTSLLLHGSAIAMGTSFYSVFKRISGTDPMKHSIKEWVEQRCGPLNETKLFKVWQPRERLPVTQLASQDIPSPEVQKGSNDQAKLVSAFGEIALSEKAKQMLPVLQNGLAGVGFRNYMLKHWPHKKDLETLNSIPPDFFNNNRAFFSARNRLALAFGNWAASSYTANDTDITSTKSELADAINHLVTVLNESQGLPADVANALMKLTGKALVNGMENYLEQLQKPSQKLSR